MYISLFRRTLVLGLSLLALPLTDAHAQAAAWSLADLGYSGDHDLTWDAPERFYSLPFNDGYTPTALLLHVQPVPGLPSAYLRAQSGGRTLGQFAITDTTSQLRIPLDRATPYDGHLPITLSLHLRSTQGCTDHSADRLTLREESTLHLRGQAFLPNSIQAFFPPHLEDVVFYVPEPISSAAAQSALWLSAFLAQRYPAASLTLAPWPDATASLAAGPTTRSIRWSPDASATLDVVASNPSPLRHAVLTLGRVEEAAQLFRSPSGQQLAMGATLRTEQVHVKTPRYAAEPTLADLGYADLHASGRGLASTLIRFDMLRFGPDRRPSQLQLAAQHTPIAPTRTGAFAQFFLNGHLIHSQLLEGHALNTTMDLPPHHLRRINTLEIRFSIATPTQGSACTEDPLLSVSIDPTSSLTTTSGRLDIAGFERFPSAQAQSYDVFVDDGSLTTTQHATRLVHALQTATSLPLTPRLLLDLDHTTDAPLIAAGGPALTQRLPSRITAEAGGSLTTSGLGGALHFNAEAPHAVLQSVRRGRQDVLLFYTTTPSAASRFFDALTLRGGWPSLSGVIAAVGPDGPMTVLAADIEHDPFARHNEASAQGFVLRHVVPLSLFAVVLVLAAFTYLMYRARWFLPDATLTQAGPTPEPTKLTERYTVNTLYTGTPPSS
ncbi:MAG: hypothetical protein RhofKO_17850 [Rhodothermales bacterium]